jgi:hypothetical protein
MIEVLQRPVLNSSTWNAVGNPIVYKFQRKDFEFNQINNVSGNAQLQFTGVNVSFNFLVGHAVYFKATDYDLSTTVIASTFSGGNTLIRLNTPYISSSVGFVNNHSLRINYGVQIRLFGLDDIQIGTLHTFSASPKGLIIASVSGMIRPELLPVINYQGPGPESDLTIFKGFYISYKEVWTGSSNSATDDDSNPIHALLASMQIPSKTGGNLIDYVVDSKRVVLNQSADFDENGWINSGTGISWSFGDDIGISLSSNGKSKLALLNLGINDIVIDVSVTFTVNDFSLPVFRVYVDGVLKHEVLNTNGDTIEIDYLPGKIISFEADNTTGSNSPEVVITSVSVFGYKKFLTKFDTLNFWAGYPMLVSAIVDTPEGSGVFNPELVIDEDGTGSETVIPIELTGVIQLNLELTENKIIRIVNGSENITELKQVKIHMPCRNPVMLLARNSLGGPLQWLFDSSQEYTHDYGGGRKAKRLVLTAERLTITEWEALEEFIGLGEVYRENIIELTPEVDATSRRIGKQVYVLNPDGSKIGVIVIPTRNTTLTRRVRHTFELEIEFPEEQ